MIVHRCIEIHLKGCVDYCNGIQDFINYALSNMRNISGGSIKCLYKRCKNKKIIDPDIVMMHLL